MSEDETTKPKRPRGFAAMDEETRRGICRKGGIAAHKYGRAHEFTPEQARAAGRKGGLAISKRRDHMSTIGQLGGAARSANLAAKREAIKRGEIELPDDLRRAFRDFQPGKASYEQMESVRRRLPALREIGLIDYDPNRHAYIYTAAGMKLAGIGAVQDEPTP